MKIAFTRIILFAAIVLLTGGLYIEPISAISAQEKELVRQNAMWWMQSKHGCTSTTVGKFELDGYRLPATKGYTARESPIEASGIATELGTHVTFAHLASYNQLGDGGESFRDYAINMRWTYAEWYWNGNANVVNQAQMNWMGAKPRLVKVSNPRTNKSVITAILEAGPAPWTGIDTAVNNDAKFGWSQPQLGTPPESSGYKGRVSGLTPKAFEAIGAITGEKNGEIGDELIYEWAPDQEVKPGTMGTASGGGTGTTSGDSCAGFVNADGYAFPVALPKNVADNGWVRATLGWPCRTYCHHDETGAFDIAHTDTVKNGNDGASAGVPVIAIRSGSLRRIDSSYRDQPGCYTFHIVADDGWDYWYGHLRGGEGLQNGQRVEVGKPIGGAQIGERRCTGNGSYPHLHIDRGSPQGFPGGGMKQDDGSVCCRDMGFVQLMNSIYASMPE